MPPALQTLIDRIGGPKRAMIAGVGLLAAVVIFGVSRWATAPEWVPAFQGLEMETVGKMTDQLDQAGVQYRLEQGGSSILVAAPDLAKARVVLAREGLPSAGRPGMELFDQPSWGMTDFTQRINYRRALEGELERTIGKMRGIEAAQVHLAIHEASSFRRPTDKPSEASVVLKLRSGQDPTSDVVQGISHLVASSVDGLEAQHVTVVDDAGRMLSDSDDPTTMSGLSSQQLKVQREVEGYLQRKAEQLVGQIVGAGNAKIQVAAAINFDRVERTTQSVNPDQQAVSTEQKSEITPGADGGAASSNTATSYDNTHQVETFSGAIGNIKRLTVAVLVNERTAPAAAPAPGAPGAPTAAASAAAPVMVARTPAELARIDTLVRTAVGLDSARGDVVSVISVPFDVPQTVTPVPSGKEQLLDTVQQVQRPALTAIGLLLVFAIALVAIKAMRPQPGVALASATATALASGESTLALADGGVTAELSGAAGAIALPAPPPRPVAVPVQPAYNPSRDQVAATVEQYPDVAARLVRNWLKD